MKRRRWSASLSSRRSSGGEGFGERRGEWKMRDARRIKEEGGIVYIKNGSSASLGSNGLSQATIALQRLG